MDGSFLEMTYEQFIDRYHSVLRRYASQFERNTEDAQDLYQETVVKIYVHFDRWDQNRDPTNWIIQIMKRTFLDAQRSRARRPQTVAFDFFALSPVIQFEDHSPSLESVAIENDELSRSVNGLTERRQKIVKALLAGEPERVVAQNLNITQVSVRQTLCRIRKQQREKVSESV